MTAHRLPLRFRSLCHTAVFAYPTGRQQYKSEFKLKEHLQWFIDHKEEISVPNSGHETFHWTRSDAVSREKLGELD